MENKNKKKASFYDKFKKYVLVPILQKYVDFVETRNAKKAQKQKIKADKKAAKSKKSKNQVPATSRQSVNPYYEQNDTPVARQPSSVGDFKNKKLAKKPREIIPQRERKEKWQKMKKDIFNNALKITAVVLAGLFVFGCGFKYYSTMRASDVEDSAKQFIEGKSRGKGYPYKINSVDVIDMQAMGGNLAVLTQENFLILSPSAKEEVRFLHGYTDPAMYLYANRALLYDRATGKYCVLNSSKVLLRGDLGKEIYSAVMNKDGALAFSLKEDSAPSKLLILNPKGKEIYSYMSNGEKIFDAAFSPNSKSVAVITIGADHAKLYSKLQLIDFESEKPLAEFKYDTVLYDVIYPSSRKVIAFGPEFKSTILKNEEMVLDYKYAEQSLDFYDKADSGRSVLVLSAHGSEGKHKIVQFDSKSKLKSETVFNEKIHAVSCSNRYVSVLFEDRTVLLDSKGKVKKEFTTNKNGKKIVNIGNDVYILYSSNIAKSS